LPAQQSCKRERKKTKKRKKEKKKKETMTRHKEQPKRYYFEFAKGEREKKVIG
jgi:hypothetical protein